MQKSVKPIALVVPNADSGTTNDYDPEILRLMLTLLLQPWLEHDDMQSVEKLFRAVDNHPGDVVFDEVVDADLCKHLQALDMVTTRYPSGPVLAMRILEYRLNREYVELIYTLLEMCRDLTPFGTEDEQRATPWTCRLAELDRLQKVMLSSRRQSINISVPVSLVYALRNRAPAEA